ncbi:MAG TPA: DUF6644 family protein [Bryobacterales bacterium]|jgi:hypothetical protein|nr:DUF6644 family protein [Bryobacterales bacterium]
MSVLRFCEWLANTQWSIALHESTWGYPIVESVHVLTLCLFLGTAVMLDLRLLGLTMRRAPVSEVVDRLLPWTTAGFAVMVASGILLFYAIPVRTFQNIFFRIKFAMLVLSGLNAWVFHAGVYRKVKEWDLDPVPPTRARIAAGLSLLLWAGIVICGRMIAYNWFDSGPIAATTSEAASSKARNPQPRPLFPPSPQGRAAE